jgi:hypothetical protein
MPVTVNIRQDNLIASTKTANLLANTDLAFAPDNGTITIYGVSSAAGINMEVGIANSKAMSDRELLFIGTTIDVSAHEIASFPVPSGAPLSLFLREVAGAGTTDVILIVEFEGDAE